MSCVILLVVLAFRATSMAFKPSEVSGRDIVAFESWASGSGVLKENGFVLSENDSGDWSVAINDALTLGDPLGDRVLQVPSSLVLSSSTIRKEKNNNGQNIHRNGIFD